MSWPWRDSRTRPRSVGTSGAESEGNNCRSTASILESRHDGGDRVQHRSIRRVFDHELDGVAACRAAERITRRIAKVFRGYMICVPEVDIGRSAGRPRVHWLGRNGAREHALDEGERLVAQGRHMPSYPDRPEINVTPQPRW